LPRDEDPASGAPPDAAARETAARVRAIVERALAAAPGSRLADAKHAPPKRARVALARDRAESDAAEREQAAPRAKAEAPAPAASAYDALQSLNRGALERQGRERKVLAAEPAAVPPGLAEAAGRAPALRVAPPPAAEARREATAPAAAPSVPPPRAQPAARVAVDPFVGRLVGEHLLLVRAVWVGERGHRQGLVLDVARLGQWLRDRALGGGALPALRLTFEPGGEVASGDVGPQPFRASHRFAEPFDGLALELHLAPLPDGPGERAVLGLAGLLVLAAAAGLFALYRMVAVRLAFAQRRSNFAAAVSHELKTPLTAIRMYVEMLRDGLVPTEEKRREYYATLGAESERLSRLIDNVLEFSRLERGTRRLELHAAPLAPVVEELVGLLRPHAERQGFALELALDANLPAVRFERDALAQILFNLVENALKYARSAGVRSVRVGCARERDRVVLTVRDRGPGVPERRLARIFEPFYRGEDELTRETGGSGIGLALVKGLAERMGAVVSARNLPEGGLEVALVFPPA
jgi:signal transduction histidine kinase